MIPRLGLGAFALLALLSNTSAQRISSTPTVTLTGNITIHGVSNSTGIEAFRGIPFAAAPARNLRYAAPSPVTVTAPTVIDASAFGPVCMQPPSDFFSLADMSEDCLSLNIFRPSGTNSNAKLPVMVWIYGGSFVSGGSPMFDPTELIRRSVQLREPIIYVSFNYRVNSFGFLASSELVAAARNGTATLNAGLYDMRAALLWVQKNVDKFGGDRSKVTVFGESVGAMSIGSLLVADRGKAVEKLGLFRGAIMESGAPFGNGVPPPAQLDTGFQHFAELSGCTPKATNGSVLSCLRRLPTAAVFNGTISLLETSTLALPFQRTIDGYFHDAAPSVQVRANRLATVPLLMGNNLDEGTYFAATNINNSVELVAALIADQYDTEASPSLRKNLLPEALRLYPDDPSLGSPFEPLNISKSDRFYPPTSTNQYKRMAAIFGDSIFHAGRRTLLDKYIERNKDFPVWNYQFTANTPGAPTALGVFHSSEISFVYGLYAAESPNSTIGKTSFLMMDYWIAFANTLHPNRATLPFWPKYGSERSTMQIGTESMKRGLAYVIEDTFREEGISFFSSEAWTSQVNV